MATVTPPGTYGTTVRSPSRSSTPSWPRHSAPSVSSARSSLTARLQHPHILPVHDPVKGRALWYTCLLSAASRCGIAGGRGSFPIEEALEHHREVATRWTTPTARGRAPRHQAVEHLLGDGQASVADFGIARAVEPPEGPS